MARRILTITSGKGGVGKTTVAINLGLALSRYGTTVLVDFDPETSAIRSFLDMPFPHDLYHFAVKGVPLGQCVTPLPERWDPRGEYRDFGVIAAPRHFIEEFTLTSGEAAERFREELHELDVDFVILDMPAGLGRKTVEVMPYSNSGILVFTPRLPAAASAAANLIKAQIFRKLELAIAPPSPLLEGLSKRQVEELTSLVRRADDVYDEEVPNLDAVLLTLREKLGHHPVVSTLQRTLEHFFVHYVLNHFDGLADSYERAVRPFVEQLARIVSARLDVRNLGWVELNQRIHEANCRGIPALLWDQLDGREGQRRHELALQEIEEMVRRNEPQRPSGGATAAGVNRYLIDQLDHLERMHRAFGSSQFPSQFRYLAATAMHRIESLRPYCFGDARLLTRDEIHRLMLEHHAKLAEGGQPDAVPARPTPV